MKLKFLTILLGLVTLVASSKAQESFIFQNFMRDTVHLVINQNDVKSHYLGQDVAIKYYRLQEAYTHVESGSDASPTSRTVVTKPNIYYSLKKLNTYYKKQLKRGEIDNSEAEEILGKYLDIGFSIRDQYTSEFETALKAAKKPEQIADVFAKVVLE